MKRLNQFRKRYAEHAGKNLVTVIDNMRLLGQSDSEISSALSKLGFAEYFFDPENPYLIKPKN